MGRHGTVRTLRAVAAASIVVGAVAVTSTVLAEGTETLGPPSIQIAEGTGAIAAGTGMWTQPGTIDIEVPAGVTVEQVLAYWEGHNSTTAEGAAPTITLDGNEVTGTRIGGPTKFFSNHWSSTYRADITELGLVVPGPNSVSVSGMGFDLVNNGAGLVVIYDDGGTTSEIELRDGNDLAYHGFGGSLQTTVPQTFDFEPAPVERVVELVMFASSVADPAPSPMRPNVIQVTVDGDTIDPVVTRAPNLLASNDGLEWDTVEIDVVVPAGASSITVQALSADDTASGDNPASFAWTVGMTVVPPYVPPATTTTTTTTTTSTTSTTTTTTTVPPTTTSTTTSTTLAPTTTTTTLAPTTTTTLPPTTTTTIPPTTTTIEPAIEVAAFGPECVADIPYIDYDIEVVGTSNDTATITFFDLDDNLVEVHEDMPLSGQVIYPGASLAPDWPGWKLNDAGFWVPDPSDEVLREGLTVLVEVNPTATASVSYPAATALCASPPENQPTTTLPPATTVAIVTELPATGSGIQRTTIWIGLTLIAAGAVVLFTTRRRRIAD